MSRTVSPVAGKAYGMARVCRVWRHGRATIYRHRQAPHGEPPRRPGPIGPMTDAALVAAIRTAPQRQEAAIIAHPEPAKNPTSPPPPAPSHPRNLRAHPAPVPHTSIANPARGSRPKTPRRPPSLRSGSRLAAAPPPGSATLPQDPEHPVNGTAGAIRAHLGRAGPLDRQRTVGGSSCHFAP